MKPIQALQARFALEKLINQELPLYYAVEVKELADKLDPILTELGNHCSDGKMEEGYDKDIDFTPLELPAALPISLSAGDIKLMEPFVRFVKEAMK